MNAATANLYVATFAALAALLGPLAAVGLTLFIERRRASRDGKRNVLQTLLATRGRYADPSYSWAIRAIRLEFATNSKVIAALDAYLNQVRIKAPSNGGEAHWRESERREGVLISEMLKDLGYAGMTSEQIESYTAQGLADREVLLEAALRALPHLAHSAMRSADASEKIVSRMASDDAQTNDSRG